MNIDSNQLLIAAMAVAGLFLVMRATLRRSRASRTEPRVSVREEYTELQRPRAAARDLEKVMLELDALAREIHGRLDTKIAKLEGVIRSADERIDRLARLQRASDGDPTLDVLIEDEHAPDAGDTPRSASETTTHPSRPDPADSAPAPPDEPTPTKGAVRNEIYALADSGLAAEQVAERTGRTTGEVELVLSLRRAQQQVARSPANAGRAG